MFQHAFHKSQPAPAASHPSHDRPTQTSSGHTNATVHALHRAATPTLDQATPSDHPPTRIHNPFPVLPAPPKPSTSHAHSAQSSDTSHRQSSRQSSEHPAPTP